MKKEEIVVGGTYCNRGVGRTTRRVISIGEKVPDIWFGQEGEEPGEPGVCFI